ncbi:MAG: hypothetical protein D6722_16520 [Bacteroidetes bacterium]|nr:MAG: hypothetical protein D6722_16520 [Bacteroidota bacterium]
MKTIGLIGGMSGESSLLYYQILNERVKARKDGLASCPCLLYSLDFAEVERLQHAGEWDQLDERMAEAARAPAGGRGRGGHPRLHRDSDAHPPAGCGDSEGFVRGHSQTRSFFPKRDWYI